MRTTKIVAALVITGMVMLSALPAQAGGGAGGGGTDFIAFQCYLVSDGDRQNRVVTLVDQFGTSENVRIERARLLCTPTTGTLVQGELEVDPGGDHLKCYSAVPLSKSPVEVEVADQFTTETLEVKKAQFVCLPAAKTVLP
jgi:hypothetical protein